PLEVEKLKLEVADLRRSSWLKPAVMIPIVGTLVTLGLSWSLGVFDVERKRVEVSASLLEIRREKLQQDVAKLEHDQKDLETSKAGLRRDIAGLQSQLNTTRANYQRLESQLNYTKTVLSRAALNIFYYLAPDYSALKLENHGRSTATIRTMQVFVDNQPIP